MPILSGRTPLTCDRPWSAVLRGSRRAAGLDRAALQRQREAVRSESSRPGSESAVVCAAAGCSAETFRLSLSCRVELGENGGPDPCQTSRRLESGGGQQLMDVVGEAHLDKGGVS